MNQGVGSLGDWGSAGSGGGVTQEAQPGKSAKARRTPAPVDERLLLHHPAGKLCLDICMANGWLPGSGDVVRLVQLWQEVRAGQHSEAALSQAHLAFARWLWQTGRINEDSATDDESTDFDLDVAA